MYSNLPQRKLYVKLWIWLTSHLLQKQSHTIKDFGSLKPLVLIQIKHWVFGQVVEYLSSVFNFKEWTLFQTLNFFLALLPGILFCKEKYWLWVQNGHQDKWCSRGNQRWSFGTDWFQKWIHTLLQCCIGTQSHWLVTYVCSEAKSPWTKNNFRAKKVSILSRVRNASWLNI